MYVGLDFGTSEIKALLMDEHGRIVLSHGMPLTIQRPYPQWSEQSAAEWWQVTNDLIAHLRAQAGARWQAVRAIGYPARCTVRCCWMLPTNFCGR